MCFTIEQTNKAKYFRYFEVLAPWLTFGPFMGAQINQTEKRNEVIFDCSDNNAPMNVFPQRGEGGHTGAIDIDVLPVSRASEQLLTQGSPQGQDY